MKKNGFVKYSRYLRREFNDIIMTKLNFMLGRMSLLLLLIGFLSSCKQGDNKNTETTGQEKKIGVLLVNHGSRSEAWRNSLLDLEKNVRNEIMKSGEVKEVKTAFMEYTEPSIATRMKEFDDAGYTDVIVVPIFLTVSSHSFDDIPTIIGLKDDAASIEHFKIEKIKRYKAKANVVITPLLDFTDILKKNVLKRYLESSKDQPNEGLMLSAYGDVTYNKEWTKLMNDVGQYVKANTKMTEYNYGWNGHIVSYNSDSTYVPIMQMLEKKKTAVVIPVLVAYDEMFQGRIIMDGVKKVKDYQNRVIYKPDAILPDKNIEQWVIDITKKSLEKINK